MKLYGIVTSPFVACVVLYANAKGISLIPTLPEGFPGSDDYQRKSPFGKIPLLEHDGRFIFETPVICDFIEDIHPTPAMRRTDPYERAKAAMVSRLAELYILPKLVALLPHLRPDLRNADFVKAGLDAAFSTLDRVEAWLDPSPYAAGSFYSVGDCMLIPNIFLYQNVFTNFGVTNVLEGRPKIAAWWSTIAERPEVRDLCGEMETLMPIAFSLAEKARAAQ